MSGAQPGFNAEESPLARLATRRGKDGMPFLSEVEVLAGERLRADFTRACLSPSITQRWDAAPRSGGTSRGAGDLSDSAIDARGRVDAAASAVGPELSGLLLDVCCFLKGLETVERERQWPVRSAKLVLKVGLAALARHYGHREARSGGKPVIRRWGGRGLSADDRGLRPRCQAASALRASSLMRPTMERRPLERCGVR